MRSLLWAGMALSISVLIGGRPAFSQSPERLAVYQRFEEARAAADWQKAVTLGREAAALAEANATTDAVDPVDLLLSLGDVLVHAGQPAEAIQPNQKALEVLSTRVPADDPALTRPLEALATIYIQLKRYDDAEAALRRVLQIENSSYGEKSQNARATLGKLEDVYEQAGRTEEAARTAAAIEKLEQSTRTVPGDDRRYDASAKGFATVRVYYGTNRAPTGEPKPARHYGGARGDLEYGYLDVTIPETHRQGELETQSRWSILTYFTSPEVARRHYVLLQNVSPLKAAAFTAALRKDVARAPSKDVLVFVHGYNSSFEDAARRTAQLAYDLDFDGTPMMYSWPSQASTAAYTVDEAAVGISGRKMAEFLDTVVAQSGATRVHLVAHSMGNRALMEALQTYLAAHPGGASKTGATFGQVVFTAPDVDRDYFADAVRQFGTIAERVTLYASTNDLALQTSEKIHGAPRAGMGGERIVTQAGLDSIDMSAVKADLLGHNYYAVDSGAIYDLFRLMWRGDPPPQRCGMVDREKGNARVWVFNVSRCEGRQLLEAGVLLKRLGDRARARVRARIAVLRDPDQRKEWRGILDRLEELVNTPAHPANGR